MLRRAIRNSRDHFMTVSTPAVSVHISGHAAAQQRS
jgi:hypothetical protein